MVYSFSNFYTDSDMNTFIRFAVLLMLFGYPSWNCTPSPARLYHYSSTRIKGVNFTAPVKSKDMDSLLFNSVKRINADWVSLIPYAYKGRAAEGISWNHERQFYGEKREGIIHSIGIAKAKGLKVMLKPHLWIMHGIFTGEFVCTTDDEWKKFEKSYEEYILDYARISDSMNVEMLCIGTELNAFITKRGKFWDNLIEKVRKVYKGKLTYAENWDKFDNIPFWDKLDFIGVDAYFPLCNAENPDTQMLTLGWKPHIKTLSEVSGRYQKAILFTEFGYRNMNYAAKEPWVTDKNESVNMEVQSSCYTALFDNVWPQPWFAGGFVWKWYDENNFEKEYLPTDYTPQGKPAEKVLEEAFRQY